MQTSARLAVKKSAHQGALKSIANNRVPPLESEIDEVDDKSTEDVVMEGADETRKILNMDSAANASEKDMGGVHVLLTGLTDGVKGGRHVIPDMLFAGEYESEDEHQVSHVSACVCVCGWSFVSECCIQDRVVKILRVGRCIYSLLLC